ncbi:MAG: bifunctional diaminohydroxyphosphoribosylaminopyrimidine deaminase/5-amino-6-(5-phosphoribosylamino)uracil reductase RibD [Fimbriimonadales bacterium]
MARNLDERLMRRAVQLSRRGLPAPNPHVGCVIARGGDIVGEGYHAFAGGPHAERVALQKAGKNARGADVFVTLEPCSHHGRTPPCTDALIAAGVSRVVYAVADPNPKAAGGAEVLRAAGIAVDGGLLSAEAEEANERFLTAMRRGRPYVVLKAAIGLDGRIALPDGSSQWITGPEARLAAHRLRAEMGCVLVGAGTVLHDNPQLTVRGVRVRHQPLRVVLDGDAVLTGSERVFSDGGETRWIRSQVNLAGVLHLLMEEGMTGVLVEGGSGVLSAFLQSGLYDAVELFVAPRILGEGLAWANATLPNALRETPTLQVQKVRRRGADLQISLKNTCPA